MKYPKIAATVRSVLRDQARSGTTTNKDATALAANRLHRPGGDLMADMRFVGIGAGDLLMMFKDKISLEVRKQLRTPITEHDAEFVFKPGVSKQLRRQLAGSAIPSWIAIEEGEDAMWVHFKSAREEHWEANFGLRQKKSAQTMAAAGIPRNIVDLMRTFGLKTLGEVFQ